jgi:tripartite-type tricarboxylate transporter receptor subunit TctC
MNAARALLGTSLLIACSVAAGQDFPSHPIRLITPYPPGGSTDLVARLVGPKLGSSLGQPVIIENRPGGAGMIGCELVARAAPDGYTLLFTTPATHTSIRFTQRSVPYDPDRDFTPITAAVTQSAYILANPSVPINSFRELVDYAKKNPGKLSYGTANLGSSFHIMGEMVKIATGIDMVHVPYKGGAPVARAIMSGEIPLAFLSNTSSMTPLRTGKVKAIVVLGSKRDKAHPDVPAITEFLPDFDRLTDWLGFYGPGGMAKPLVQRIHGEIIKALHSPDVEAKLQASGMEVWGTTPEEFAQVIRRDTALYRKMVPIVGIKPQ